MTAIFYQVSQKKPLKISHISNRLQKNRFQVICTIFLLLRVTEILGLCRI